MFKLVANTFYWLVIAPALLVYFVFDIIVFRIFGAAFKEIFGGLWRHEEEPVHGDAKWADEQDLKKAGHLKPGGWLVQVVRKRVFTHRRIFTHPEASVLGIAPKGQGKTQTAIASLLEMMNREEKPDIIVNDAAGDITKATREAAKQAGYRVLCIDLVNPRKGDKYDVLSYLRPSYSFDYDRDIDAFCQLVLPDDVKVSDEHWQQSARNLLVAMVLGMEECRPAEATLYRCVHNLTADKEWRDKLFDEFRKKSSNPIMHSAISAFLETGERERGSIGTTTARKLKVWLRRAVGEVTQTDRVMEDGSIDRGWTWEEVFTDKHPTIVYIRTGLGTDEGAVARLILGNAINTRRRMFNRDMRFRRPLRIMVDEARTIGNCNAIMDANNELRKAGVSVMLWYLSLKDVRSIFPEADTLIAGCNLVVFGGSNEFGLYEEVSKLIGDRTIESGSRSESDHGHSRGASEQARRHIKADELRKLPFEKCVAVMGPLATLEDKPFALVKRKGETSVQYL